MNQENFEDLQGILPKLEGMHILLFDPDKPALNHTKSMLKQAFYTVIATREQSFALKMLEHNVELIDLIMIDDKPQEMDCLTFIRKIKDVKETIPIVLLSSREIYLSATLIQIGACHVVSKPISNGEVKSLWKQANGWRTEVYMIQTTIEDKAKRALPLRIDPIGKGKALSFGLDASLYGDKDTNKKRHEIYDTSYDEQDDEEYGNGRKKSRVYTAKLHKKCMEIIDKKTDYSVRISRRPTFSASSTPIMRTILHQSKDKAGGRMDKSSSILGVQTPRANKSDAITLTSDGSTKIHYPSKNLDFGFPMKQVLESTPVIQDTTQRIMLSPSGSSTHVSRKGIATNTNNSGMKRAMSNDLGRFSHLVHAQSSFLASNGEYMRKKQLSESSLLNSKSTELLPSISNNNISLSNTAGIINVEENALSGFSFGSPTIYEQAQTETVFGSAGVFQENEKERENPVSLKFNEISMEEFLEGLLDKPEGSTSSSTLSSGMFQGLETNAADHSQRPTSNLGSFTENGSSLPEPMNIDDPFVQLNNFGTGMSPSEDIFNDIARQWSFEGMF